MCYSWNSTHTVVDEGSPLLPTKPNLKRQLNINKAENSRSSTYLLARARANCGNLGSKSIMSLAAMWRPRLLSLLNWASAIIALVGLYRYARLVAEGEYFTWGTPLFIAAAACKLLSTSQTGHGNKFIVGGGSGNYSSLNAQRRLSHAKIMIPTLYQRSISCLKQSCIVRRLRRIYKWMSVRVGNDSRAYMIIPSLLVVAIPCGAYFANKISGHLRGFAESGKDVDHAKLANDFGKAGASALSFLLLPVSRHSPIFCALGFDVTLVKWDSDYLLVTLCLHSPLVL